MKKLTYKDMELLLTMGANGFGLDCVHYNNGYLYIEMTRFEDQVRAIIKQEEKEGLIIYECKS